MVLWLRIWFEAFYAWASNENIFSRNSFVNLIFNVSSDIFFLQSERRLFGKKLKIMQYKVIFHCIKLFLRQPEKLDSLLLLFVSICSSIKSSRSLSTGTILYSDWTTHWSTDSRKFRTSKHMVSSSFNLLGASHQESTL